MGIYDEERLVSLKNYYFHKLADSLSILIILIVPLLEGCIYWMYFRY